VFTRNYDEKNSITVRGCSGSLAKLARAGVGRTEWVFEAIQDLKAASDAERIGVWLEEIGNFEEPGNPSKIFRGEVWDEGTAGDVMEWTRLTIDAPLPLAALKSGFSCEYQIEQPHSGPILAPQLQLSRVLWVPVFVRRALRGLVMAGTLDKKKQLPCAEAERVAGQLELLCSAGAGTQPSARAHPVRHRRRNRAAYARISHAARLASCSQALSSG
jgi:hypothetical protein